MGNLGICPGALEPRGALCDWVYIRGGHRLISLIVIAIPFVDGGGAGRDCWRRRCSSLLTRGGVLVAKSSKKRTSPEKRGRLITLAYLPWWKSEPNFENRLTAIISLSRDKSLAITQHGNADNGPPLVYIYFIFFPHGHGCRSWPRVGRRSGLYCDRNPPPRWASGLTVPRGYWSGPAHQEYSSLGCSEIRGKKPPTHRIALTHFICLALSLLPMKRMERHCIIKLHARRTHNPPARGGLRALCFSPPPRSKTFGRRGLHDAW